MKLLISFTVILLTLMVSLPQPTKGDDVCAGSVENLKKKSAHLAKRFSDNKLSSICQRESKWNQMKGQVPPTRTLTTAQAKYLNDVRTCRGKQCIGKRGKGKGKGKGKGDDEPDRKKRTTLDLNLSTIRRRRKSTTVPPVTIVSRITTVVGSITTDGVVTTVTPSVVSTVGGATTLGVSTTDSSATTLGVSTTDNSATTLGVSTTGSSATTLGVSTTDNSATTLGVSTTGSSATTLGVSTTGSSATTLGVSTTGSSATTTGPDEPTTVVRKEYRSMTDAERNDFHSALNALKTNQIDGVSKYDLIVGYHLPSVSPEAHFGCSFVPWHREYLKQMEVALRWEVNDTFIPYWDSTLDEGLPTPCDSILWSDTFMGNNRGRVTSGPFAGWVATQSFPGTNHNGIERNCGSQDGDLFQQADIDYIMTKNIFQDAYCFCSEPTFESEHGLVHVYVGGHMTDITLSPNDPVFFMHHTFIDYLWEQWRLQKQTRQQRESDYPPDAASCGPEYNGNAPMRPFPGLINKDGLSNNYTDDLYTYTLRPTCPQSCTGPYLFCSTRFTPPRCLSKIRLGGNCQGYNGQPVCYNGNCVNNRCA